MPESPTQTYLTLLNRLRYKHLLLIISVHDLGNLHEAAQSFNMTQPAVTRMLHEIENTFGFPLFERLPRGMRPTALGTEAVHFARTALAELERFVGDLSRKQGGGYGQLFIGAIMGAVPGLVANAMAEIKSRKPLLMIRVMGEISDQIVVLLEQRKIELAIGRFSMLLHHNLFDFEALGNEILCVVVRKGHSLASHDQLSLKELCDWPWVLQTLTSPARQIVEAEFERANVKTPSNLVECGSIFANLLLVEQTDAITVLPESVLRDHLKTGLVVELPLSIGKTLPPFGILTRKDEQLSEIALEFVDILRRLV